MNVGTTLDHELTRYARELGAQYKTVGDAQSISEDEITHAMWQQCASRTGVLGDGSRLRSVREFLSEAHEQSQAASSGLDGLDGLTNSGAVMGSLNYMAPEQALGNLADIGPWTDVYALGGILYELLTGQTPNRANSLMERIIAWADSIPAISPRQLTPDLSRDLEAVCLKCLEKRSNSRYQSAADLAEDLTRFLDGYSPRLATAGNRIEPTLPTNTGEVISTVESDAPTPPDQHPVTKSWWPFGRKRSKAPQ